jgi:hypothetical protein
MDKIIHSIFHNLEETKDKSQYSFDLNALKVMFEIVLIVLQVSFSFQKNFDEHVTSPAAGANILSKRLLYIVTVILQSETFSKEVCL